jgi:hypothetical protein
MVPDLIIYGGEATYRVPPMFLGDRDRAETACGLGRAATRPRDVVGASKTGAQISFVCFDQELTRRKANDEMGHEPAKAWPEGHYHLSSLLPMR